MNELKKGDENKMDINDLTRRFESKEKTDEEWLQLEKHMIQFLHEDHPVEEKKRLSPLGQLEVVAIICDGIKRERGLIK